MSVNDEEKPKPMPLRRSSLKSRQLLKFDPNALMKKKRNSVSWGKTNTFEFKTMKAMFKEGEDANKEETKEDKEKHQQFLKDRKASIKNEFSLIKELMKKNADAIIEEEENDEAKKNMKKNLEMGKKALEEESESSESKSNSGSDKNSDDEEKKSESKSNTKSSKSSPKKSSKNSSRKESEDEKDKNEKKTDKNLNEKIDNQKNFKNKEKENNLENKDKEENKIERISVKKNKKPKFVQKEEETEKKESVKESEKEKEDKSKKNENKEEGGKIRLIDLKEAQKLELEKIAYIALTDGTVIIIKNQGENLVQDLLKIPNPLLKGNKIQQNYSKKGFEKEINQNKNAFKEPNNFMENKYKAIYKIPERSSNYNNIVSNKNNQKTYSITTGSSSINSNYLNYSANFNRPIIIPKSYFFNQENPKYYSKNKPDFDNNNDYQNLNNNPLSQYKTQIKTQRNKSQIISSASKPVNYYQNQQTFQPNYLDSSKNKYIYQNSRNMQLNYATGSKNQYQNQFKNTQNNNSNYLNYTVKPESTRVITSNYNQTSTQLIRPIYNQNIKDHTSQLNNRYQYQRNPTSFPNRNVQNFHNRFNSFQMIGSFNSLDDLEEDGQYNFENDEVYLNSNPKYRETSLGQNNGKLKNPNSKSQTFFFSKKVM